MPTDAPGYVVARLEEKVGQHSSDTAQINFENCRIPAENLIGEEGEGYRIALSALEGGRIGIAAQSVGMARSAFEAALPTPRSARASARPSSTTRRSVSAWPTCATQIEAARQLIWHYAASLRDAGKPCLKEAAMAKLFASEMAEEVCSAAIQTLGGYGYVSDFPVERIWRDVRVPDLRRHVGRAEDPDPAGAATRGLRMRAGGASEDAANARNVADAQLSPSASTLRLAIDSLRPTWASAPCCEKGLNRVSAVPGGSPPQWSATSMSTSLSPARALRVTSVPARVNLKAFWRMLRAPPAAGCGCR